MFLMFQGKRRIHKHISGDPPALVPVWWIGHIISTQLASLGKRQEYQYQYNNMKLE
jgi:hypothetical protein